mgnify:CR=1 FL=1
MLVTDYLVGRDEKGNLVSLVVQDVLPVDCLPGRSEIVARIARQDLVQEFVQDGVPVDWIAFPDLPEDVVELLQAGKSLTIIDKSDDTAFSCVLSPMHASAAR